MRSKLPLKFIYNMFFKTPDIIPPMLRLGLRKYLTVDWDYKRGDGISSKSPLQISLRITNLCNHRCAVCGQYGEKGYMHTTNGKHLFNTLDVEVYKKLVDEVAYYKPLFYLTGGEPFLYPKLMELMKYIKQKGCLATLVTNGSRLKDNAKQIVEDGWDYVMVSLDGPEEVHDKCRGVKGAYRAAVDGLIALRKEKEMHKKAKPYILTSTTISKVNADILEKTFEIGNKVKPDYMIVYLSWFTSEELGKAHSEIIKKEFGIEPYTWKSYTNRYNEIELDSLVNAIKKVKEKKWPFSYLVIPNIPLKDVKDYYKYPAKMFGYSKCAAPFFMIDIMPNGDVVTCRDYVDIKVGNIIEKPLLEIWNDKGFVKFRKLLIKRKGLLPICSRCCGLMGY